MCLKKVMFVDHPGVEIVKNDLPRLREEGGRRHKFRSEEKRGKFAYRTRRGVYVNIFDDPFQEMS